MWNDLMSPSSSKDMTNMNLLIYFTFYYHNSFCFIFHRFYYFYQLDLFFILALTKLSVLKRNLINLSI